MRTATACLPTALFLLLSLSPAGVHAQEPPAHKKMAAGASVGVYFPQGDADETAETSPGVRAQFVYWVHPMVGIVGSFDWVFVAEKDGAADTTYYDVSAGARVTMRGQAKLKPFGELLIGRHTLSVDDANFDESDIGFRLGGGGTYELGDSLQGFAQISYSTVDIDAGFGSLDIEAFVIEAGALVRF